MVEFGQKLEDNKVDQWADKYIDYEKLKAILKRAKAAVEYRDDIIKRMPAGAVAEVVQERNDRRATASARGNKIVSEGDATPKGGVVAPADNPPPGDEQLEPLKMGRRTSR